LIAKWSAADSQRSYLLSLTSDNRVRFWASSLGTWGTLQELTSFGTIGTEWTHIAATYDGTTMKIYINGVKDANEVSTVISIFEGTAPLMFGVHPAYITHGWVPGYFKGLIDEVRIWNGALSADEIKSSIMIESYYTHGFCDDFDDGDYSGWSAVTGDASWSVTSDGVLHNDGSVVYPRILVDSTMTYGDYSFEADARLISGPGYALIFRAADHNNFYSFQYDAGLGLRLRLYQFVGFPSGADVAPTVSYNIDDNWHHLKVVVVGNNIKCYIDGNKVFGVTDTDAPAPLTGGIGFRTWGNAVAEFDNVCVAALPLNQYGVWNPDTVPVGIIDEWAITVKVTGGFDDVEDVVVQGGIGADLEVRGLCASQGSATHRRVGKNQQGAWIITWDVGALGAGEEATLTICVATGKNPKDKQEYTRPGIHYLDGGFSATYSYQSVQYQTSKTQRLPIEAVSV